MTFKPFLDVIPDEQRSLWPALKDIPVPLEEGPGATGTLYGRQFPPTEAVKALSCFNEGDATNVDPATQAFLSNQAGAWDFTTAEIVKVADSLD